MRRHLLFGVAIALIPPLQTSPSRAQDTGGDVYWHIDPNVKTCSMVIDPSLTQAQWERFTRQAGALLSFKSLAPAEPVGERRLMLGFDYSTTPVDQRDQAWINTFTHPDADCPLGDEVAFPMLRARWGLSDRVDVGGFWTTAPKANYGLGGGEARYAFLTETPRIPAATISASVTTLTGVPDFNFSVYSVGVTASKRLAGLTPYLGVRENLAVGTETTSKVDLDAERIPITQGFLGATWSFWKIGLAAEYDVAQVNTFAAAIGFNLGVGSR